MHASTLNVFEIDRQGREVKSLMNDMPYGDPFSGTPYSQYNKSKALGMVIGVIASVVTMGAALPMLASGLMATQIAGGVMMAGGVMTGIGAITGNKKLSKIGGILSLAGGIGGAVSNMTNGLGMGAGSTAVRNMGGKMMESVNSLGINVYNPEAASAAANAGSETAKAAAAAQPAAGEIANIDLAKAPSGSAALESGPEVGLRSGTADTGILNRTTNTTTLGGVESASAPSTIDIAAAPNLNAGVSPVTPAPGLESGPEVGLNSGIKDPNALKAAAPTGIVDKGLAFMKENPELTKIGTGALTEFGKSAMSPDQSEVIAALSEKYSAEANVLKSQNDLLQYQNANRQKQVALISADDPNLDAKVKEATAKGNAVAFIPVIGAGGIKQTNKMAWNQGAAVAAQTPTRPAPVYGQPA